MRSETCSTVAGSPPGRFPALNRSGTHQFVPERTGSCEIAPIRTETHRNVRNRTSPVLSKASVIMVLGLSRSRERTRTSVL